MTRIVIFFSESSHLFLHFLFIGYMPDKSEKAGTLLCELRFRLSFNR